MPLFYPASVVGPVHVATCSHPQGLGQRTMTPILAGGKEVAARTTRNAKNLESLGPERMAELLIEISAGNAAAKRRLRLELAGAQSPGTVAKEVRKRLTAIARSRSFVEWQGVRSLADDLDTLRRAIVERVAKTEPTEALDLLWRFMGLASSVFERCDDSNGVVIGVFHETCRDIGDVALKAK